jgi:bacillithiol biosynthesis cysteine-adding enzyme BshC
VPLEFQSQPLSAPSAVPDWPALAEGRKNALAPGLSNAFRASGAAAETNLKQLLSGAARCVTTGQQPGLLTGPLYTIYKALSAVAFADQAARRLGSPVVPVFWVAGDDHDFVEGNHFRQLNQKGDLESVVLRERATDAPLTPLYREPVGPEIRQVFDTVLAAHPDSEFRSEVVAWMERHYRPEATLSSAYRDAVAELLGRFGLVVFDPTAAAAKKAMAPWLLRAIEASAELDQGLVRRNKERAARGHAITVPAGDGATLVMIEGKLGRDRLTRDGTTLVSRRAGEKWTLAELGEVAESDPQRLSPNVLLRPVVEAALLPTLAYVAGPGELAYLPECDPVYATLGVQPQQPIGRWSAVLVEARVRKVMDRFGLTTTDLNAPEGRLEARLMRDELPSDATDALAHLRKEIEGQYARLVQAAVSVDPTLQKPVESARNGALSGLSDVERKMVQHLKQKQEVLLGQVTRARRTLFPGGKPQERVFNVVPFLLKYGPVFLDDARAAIESHVVGLEAGG